MSRVLIRLDGVGFHYRPERPILAGLDFELAAGERVGLVGSNGSGKTTLLQLIVGLVKPLAGRIEAFGRPRLSEADFAEVRAKAGLLFQDPEDQLFSPTVLEDVAFGPLNLGRTREEARRIAVETLASLGLEGYEGRITHKLSGGEKRLVSLAAVLAMEPEVLLLDEPGAGLDEDSLARIRKILLGLDQAMIIVSHRRDFLVGLAERTVRLHQGRLAAWDLDWPLRRPFSLPA